MENLRLEAYGTHDIIAQADSKIDRFVNLSNMSPLQYGSELWIKKLRGLHVYDEYVLNRIFVEGLLQSITNTMQSYWSSHKDSPLEKGVSRHDSDENSAGSTPRGAGTRLYEQPARIE